MKRLTVIYVDDQRLKPFDEDRRIVRGKRKASEMKSTITLLFMRMSNIRNT